METANARNPRPTARLRASKRRHKAGGRSLRALLLPSVAALVGAAIGGCATGVSGSSSSTRASSSSDCIRTSGIRSYTALDRRNLIIEGGGQHYHVVLASPSIYLMGEFMIGVFDRDGQVCPFGGDLILVEGPLTEEIPISSIERIDRLRADELEIEYGREESAEGIVTTTPIE